MSKLNYGFAQLTVISDKGNHFLKNLYFIKDVL